MAKKKCDICGTEVGILSQRKLKDGMVCWDCMKKVGKEFTEPWAESFSVEQISKAITGEITLLPPQVFQCANGVLVIDSSNRVMYMSMLLGRKSEEILLDSILGYSYVEDDKKYGVGRVLGAAAVGGIFFGGAGAVIGSVIGSNPKRKIKHMGVEITYGKDNVSALFCADIYKGKAIKASGFEYNGYLETAKLLMGEFDLLIKKDPVEGNMQKDIVVQSMSYADEIRKFKGLLDDGIITQEEYDTKRKQLLGL